MTTPFRFAVFACALFCATPVFAAGDAAKKMPAMDAAATGDSAAPAADPAHDPYYETGTWSAKTAAPASADAPAAPANPDDPAFESGTWSASGGMTKSDTPAAPKSDAAAPAPAPAAAAAATNNDSGYWSASNPLDKAKAADGDGPMAQHTMSVTSVQDCLDKLTPAEAAEIRNTTTAPYAACKQKLQDKTDAKQAYIVGQQNPEAETPRNYVRVQKDPDPAPTAPKGLAGTGIIPDNSKGTPNP